MRVSFTSFLPDVTATTFYGPDQIEYLQTVLGEATAAGGSNLQVCEACGAQQARLACSEMAAAALIAMQLDSAHAVLLHDPWSPLIQAVRPSHSAN